MAERPRRFHGWYGSPAIRAAVQFPDGPGAGLGVVVCHPFGQEGVIAYRGLRLLADRLAEQGLASVRYDPPGRGDAAPADGPDAFADGARTAAELLRGCGCTSIAFVGLSSAAVTAAAVAGTDDLVVLWDAPASGRRWLRRARSLATMTLGPDRLDDGIESLVGLELSPEQARVLSAGEIVRPAGSRTLVVARRGGALLAGVVGAERVEVEDLPAFLDVSSTSSVLPLDSIERIVGWLANQADARDVRLSEPDLSAELVQPGFTERIRRLGPNELFAIETRPRPDRGSAPMVVLHNGSSEHRVGPADFQVELARRIAADGFASVRIDRRGTGETGEVVPGNPDLIYSAEWVEDQDAALAALDIPADRLVLAGLCAGAWLSALPAGGPRRLVVAIHPNWYQIEPLAPGAFTEDLVAAPIIGGLRLQVQRVYRRWAPVWLRRYRARFAGGTDATRFLTELSGTTGQAVLLIGEVEQEILARRGGVELLPRLPNITAVLIPTIDHPLFARRTRQRVIQELRRTLADVFETRSE